MTSRKILLERLKPESMRRSQYLKTVIFPLWTSFSIYQDQYLHLYTSISFPEVSSLTEFSAIMKYLATAAATLMVLSSAFAAVVVPDGDLGVSLSNASSRSAAADSHFQALNRRCIDSGGNCDDSSECCSGLTCQFAITYAPGGGAEADTCLPPS